jgi:hypothetical protein
MSNPVLLAQEQIELFNREGYLIIPDFYDLEEEIRPIQSDIYDIIGLVADKYEIRIDRSAFSQESFDQCYLDVIAKDRSYGGEIYDAVKQIPAFIRLVASKKNEEVFRALRPKSFPGVAAAGYGIRINNPFEDKFRANWHQEYPSQLRSLDGLVFWSPLVNVTQELGPVIICPESQTEGAVPVYTHDPRNKEKQGAYSLVLQNEGDLINKYRQISPLSKPTDLVVMDFLLLHASGHNIGNRALWSMQIRYFNFLEATGRRHGWKGGFASGVDFRTIHPELCVDL